MQTGDAGPDEGEAACGDEHAGREESVVVKPILIEHCSQCHGPKKHESGFRLHNKHDFFAGGDGGLAIVVGKSAESRLIHFVSGADPDTKMPPDGESEPLSPDQIALVRAWIDQGALWPDSADQDTSRGGSDHWAYKPPVRHDLPAVKNSAWPKNPIDQFALARMEAEGLAPSPDAERAILADRSQRPAAGREGNFADHVGMTVQGKLLA